MEIKTLLNQMTTEEKLKLITGKSYWETFDIPRLEVSSIKVNDGPHGSRFRNKEEGNKEEDSYSTLFPSAVNTASTWNVELVRELGEHLGNECIHTDTDVLLGPGTNIKRTPLCGRNFEYFSEDPLLSGELAAAYINGIQSKHVGACIKHFAANNQEYDRAHISSDVDERTLREIYLKPFEIAIKKANPWTIMCAYNKLNGIYCSEHKWLLTDILKEEWGFEGVVMSDWYAVHNRSNGIEAGLDLEMPFTEKSYENAKRSYENSEFTLEELDESCERIIALANKVVYERALRDKEYMEKENRDFAIKIAEESMILLKNEEEILPIDPNKKQKIAVIGHFAEKAIVQGGGSAYVGTKDILSPLEEIRKIASPNTEIVFEKAYINDHPVSAVDGLNNAIGIAAEADMCIVFVGDTDKVEAEGYDRASIKMHPYMEDVILRITKANPNTVVVVEAGSAIDMCNWIEKVKAIVYAGYMGVTGAAALAKILFGHVNPSGKIAETFPLSLGDIPCKDSYPGNGFSVTYNEGFMVGYRYYEAVDQPVLFPFGYGLSYTKYEYSDITLSAKEMEETDILNVKFNLLNSGLVTGKETVQIYVREFNPRVQRPVKELKAFTKIDLEAGQWKEVQIQLDREAFAYYSTALKKWHVNEGVYEILVGASSADIKLRAKVRVNTKKKYS